MQSVFSTAPVDRAVILSDKKTISAKEFDKLSKYENLVIENARMWHLNRITFPMIIGELEMIRKNTDTHIKRILQNSCLFET